MSNYTPFVNGQSPAHTAINQRLNELEAAINSLLQGFPLGTVIINSNSSPPSGWLVCDGSAVSRSTYSTLFALIGTTFGVGDGTTTFNLPDLRGRTIIGVGAGPTLTNRTLGQSLGEENHQLTIPEMRAHIHNTLVNTSFFLAAGAIGGAIVSNSVTGSTGSDTPHNTMQPSLGMRYIMRVQ